MKRATKVLTLGLVALVCFFFANASADIVYVSNANASTIEKFTPVGAGSVFASTGLSAPFGLAFDSADNLYAANSGNSTVEKFTPGVSAQSSPVRA
jgi:hypothetical protein